MAYFRTSDVIDLCLIALAERTGFPVELTGSQVLGGGSINQAMRIRTTAGDFFVKWNASAPPDMFGKEAAGLVEMQQPDHTLLKIPKVIWHKDADEKPGILMLEYLPSIFPTPDSEHILGRGLAQLHRKTTSQFGFYQDNYCGTTVQDNTWTDSWPEFYAFRRIHALVQQIRNVRGLSAEELKLYDRLIDRMPQLLAHQTVPSLIHGDLWSGNCLFSSFGPALIDPACYYADREMELGMMKLFGGFSSRVWSAYQEEFPLPYGWADRIRLYQLYHILNHFLLFGGSYGMQANEIAKAYR